MISIQEYVDIRDHTTFKIGGLFRYFTEIRQLSDLLDFFKFAKEKNLPYLILGDGSNMVFPDGVLDCVVAKMNNISFEIVNDTDKYVDIKIGAGENWDSVVERTVMMNLSGIEAMSSIPGTTGATPVQNVGAYGQEIKDTLLEVEVFEIDKGIIRILSNTDCNFSYRNSIFKGSTRGKYVIISVTLRLLKEKPLIPDYPGVKKYFLDNNIDNPTLIQIREAIIDIRKNKLPDPKVIPNIGSFFKNNIVDKRTALNLKRQYPNIVLFPVNENEIKVPSGFLIETAGLKGKSFGNISVYDKNALVLVNNNNATCNDVIKTKDEIIKNVFDKFGITLETEPEFV